MPFRCSPCSLRTPITLPSLHQVFPALALLFIAGTLLAPRSSTAGTFAAPPPDPDSVAVSAHPNVETAGILLALAFEEYGFGDFALPVAARAQQSLGDYRGHPAVLATRDLVQDLGIDGYTGLALHAAPYADPTAGQLRVPLPASLAHGAGAGDERSGRCRIEAYLQQVADFYRAADVGAFLDAHAAAYARAEVELGRMAPAPGLIAAMEDYFGEHLNGYTIVPTLTLPPFGNVGVALACNEADSTTPACRDAYFVMGARRSVAQDALLHGEAAGFYDPADPDGSRQYATDLAVHEFGHAFINPYLQAPAAHAEIARHAHLMDAVRERMAPQAYTDWYAVAVEHVVRATEIRIALAMGDTARADRLREAYLDERSFAYLPWLERAAARYEQRRSDTYPTFGDFVLEMLQAFGKVDTQAVRAARGQGNGPLRRITIRVTGAVPADDAVFLTGGHAALGDWNPGHLRLEPAGSGAWAGTFEIASGTRLPFKVTRGSWATEAADADGRPRPNSVIEVRADTSITLHVERWLDQ